VSHWVENMTHVKVSVRIRRDAGMLWREVGSFQGIGFWHPLLAKVRGTGEQPGGIRIAETHDGQRQVERLQWVAPDEHFYRYMMLSTPLPILEYIGEFRIRNEGRSASKVSWSGDFQVISSGKRQIARLVREFFNTGLQNLRRKYP